MNVSKEKAFYNIIKRLWLLVISAAVLLSSVCVFPNKVYAKRDGIQETVRVGYYENENFQEGMTEDSVKSGYSYEYLQKIASITGWNYDYVYGSWSDLYRMLVNGEIDLLAGVGYEEDASEIIGYPSYPMGHDNYYVYTGNGSGISSELESLNGKNIGVMSGVMYRIVEDFMADKDIQANIIPYESTILRDKAYEIGAVDAFVGEALSISYRENVHPVVKVGSANIYLCVKKKRNDLLRELNSAAAQIDNTDPYYIETLSKKYYNQSAVNLQISDIEKQWLARHNFLLRVGYLEDYLPYCGTGADGKATGALVDVLDEGLENLGIRESMTIDYKAYSSTDEMLDALIHDEVDTLFPVTDNIWYLDQNDMFHSKTVVTSSMNLVYLGRIDDDTTKTIAVNRGNEVQEEYVKESFPDAEILYMDSIHDCLMAVNDGSVGSTVISGFRTNYVLTDDEYDNLHYAQLAKGSVRCFGVSAGDSKLLSLIDRAITSLDEDAAIGYIYKYVDNDNSISFGEFIRRYIILILIVALIVIIIFVSLIAVIIYKTRKQDLLYEHAYKDSLTGLFNRRSYEEDFDRYEKSPKDMSEDFTYISMDLNGLKRANDNYGHTAGDEMIIYAGETLSKSFGQYGKVYRTGGDEYVALIDISKSNYALCMTVIEKRCAEFQQFGLDGMTISIGRVRREEMPDATIMDICKEADKRMYNAKAEYYKKNNIDRRIV